MMVAQLIDLNWVTLKSKWIFQDKEIRLNASSYSFESIKARELIESIKKRTSVESVNNLSEKIFVGARVKRLFTNSKEGIPYLMPIDLFMFNLKPRKWVRKETKDLENWWVKPFTILITQSGTPGRCLLMNKLFKDKVVSPNVIRIVPNEKGYKKIGYLYAYLNTWIGQAFLTKDQYGATVKHIETHHVANIPIPRIQDLEEEINKKILETHKLREEAQELLLKAEEMIYSELGLPKINEDDVEYFGDEIGRLVKAFEVKASELNYRLDVSYHLPIIKMIEKYLAKIKVDVQILGNKLESVFIPPRFKRPYVGNQDEGIRYIRPSDLPMIKYFEPKYFAKTFKNCDLYRLKEGDILVVTDGTIGWASIVTPFITGWYGSNNFARIVPTEDLHRGYLLAYLHSPYGQYQLKREIFGGVIDHLTEDHIRQIKIPIPSSEVQEKIGSLVIEAYNKKDKANQIEEEAVKQLEETLTKIA